MQRPPSYLIITYPEEVSNHPWHRGTAYDRQTAGFIAT